MEALQAYPGSTERLPKPAPQSSISYVDSIKSRLGRIPTIPSFAVVPSLPSGRDHAESLSTITTTTTATELPSNISTARTSLLSLPQVFVVQKFYVSPSMPIDEKIKLVWTQRIRSRLSALLLRNIPTGTCVQEFMMVGKKANALKPTLVITCGDTETKKRVEKSFKSQGWLPSLLKENGITFVALVAKTTLSAGPVLNPSDTARLSECYSVQLQHDSAATSCGLPLLVNPSETHPQRHCTLGGLLMVNGEIFGLTAGHPFTPHFEHESAQYEHDIAQGVRPLEDEESSEAFSEPFVFNDDDDDRGDLSSASTLSFHSRSDLSSTSIDDPTNGQHDISNTFSPSVKWSQPYSAVIPLSIPPNALSFKEPLGDSDWALLEMLPHSVITLPNKIAHIDSRHDILVEKTVTGLVHGEVTIMTAFIGAQLGYLHSSPVTMKVNKSILNVQLITLEHILPLGSSGAWVILGEELCGFIVAIRQDVPWAYMMPIEPILEDIKQKFRTADVRLPKRGEIESQAVSSEISETLTVIEKDGQIPGSDSGRVNKPAALLGHLLRWNNLPILENPPGLPLEKGNHPSNRQEDETINEKSSGIESIPETSIAIQDAPPPELSDNMNGVNRSATCHPRPAPLPVAPGILPRRISPELTQPVNTYISSLIAPMRGLDWRSEILPVRLLEPTRLPSGGLLSTHQTTYTAPYMLWHRFETSLLRIEYRRTQPRRGHRARFQLAQILNLPNYPHDGESESLQPAIAQGLLISWYYVRLLFFAFWNVILNILYFIACFPCLFWIGYRHRDVLVDEETLRRQRVESREMLGHIDYDWRR